MFADSDIDPEYARALRDLRSDVIDEVALGMLGSSSPEVINAIRDRLSRALPRLVAVPFVEISNRHARRLARDPTRVLVLNGRERQPAKKRDAASRGDRCVNENKRGSHGPATHGCRCEACDTTHRRSA